MRRSSSGLIALLLSAGRAAAQLEGLDRDVEAAMKEWQVPGLALAVVKDGRVMHSKAYGYRDLEKKLPVTPRTLFGIGSITKSFTVLALSTLAEEGKLDWERPVRDYAPDFRLKDAPATALATTADLVSHRTGLPRHDNMWFTGFGRADIFARLRYLEPSRDFRSTFQYNNVMYMAAGMVAERIAGGGRTWEELVRERLFLPLGMRTSNFSVQVSEKTDDWSRNYALDKDELKLIPPTYAVEAICPAGCINSTLEEMTRYLELHLQRGVIAGSGNRLLPARHFELMREPRIFFPAGGFGSERLGPGGYGMGFAAVTYRGHRMVFHTGSIGGYHSLLAFLPEDNLGVMILANRVARAVPQLLALSIWDRLLGLEPGGWHAKFAADEKAAKEKAAAARQSFEAGRKQGTKPSHSAAEYAGIYKHPAYGEVAFTEKAGEISFRFGGQPRTLHHHHYDVFSYDDQQRLRFITNTAGEIDQVAVRLEPAVDEIVFTKAR